MLKYEMHNLIYCYDAYGDMEYENILFNQSAYMNDDHEIILFHPDQKPVKIGKSSLPPALTMSLDGSMIFWGHINGFIWEKTGDKHQKKVKIEGHKREIMDCVFTQNNNLLVTISSGFGAADDYSLRVFDVSIGEMLKKIDLNDHFKKLHVSSDGTYAVVLRRDSTWSAFNLETGDCLWEKKFKNSELDFQYDGKLLLHKGDLIISQLDIICGDVVKQEAIALADHLCRVQINSNGFCSINRDKEDNYPINKEEIISKGYRWWLMPDGSHLVTIRVDIWGGLIEPFSLNAVVGPDGGVFFEPSVTGIFLSDDRKLIVAVRDTIRWNYRDNYGYNYKSRYLYEITPLITAIADYT